MGPIPKEIGRCKCCSLSFWTARGGCPDLIHFCFSCFRCLFLLFLSRAGHRLTDLKLDGNQLNGELPVELVSKLKRLEILHLDHNEFQGEIPFNIGQLKLLKRLWLANNRFHGFIPPSLLELSRLETLALEFNALKGYIPPELANLNKLKMLRLDHNDFNGEIPRTFGLLTNLVELELGTGEANNNALIENFPVTLDTLHQWRSEPVPLKKKGMSFDQFKQEGAERMTVLAKELSDSVTKMFYHKQKRASRWETMVQRSLLFDNRQEHVKKFWAKTTAPGAELSEEEKKEQELLSRAKKR